MNPITLIVVPGVVGGLAIALLIIKLHHRRRPDLTSAPVANQSVSTDVINMARIRVAGLGGVGLVAMALVVAWFVPRIGQTLMVGAVLGGALAVGLILHRRRAGPMPSSGRSAGANATLSIDRPSTSEDEDTGQPPTQNVRRVEPAADAV